MAFSLEIFPSTVLVRISLPFSICLSSMIIVFWSLPTILPSLSTTNVISSATIYPSGALVSFKTYVPSSSLTFPGLLFSPVIQLFTVSFVSLLIILRCAFFNSDFVCASILLISIVFSFVVPFSLEIV